MSWQSWNAVKARRTSFEADRDLGLSSVDDDDAAAVGDSLVTDCARVSSLGVVMGESEGDLGESMKSERCPAVFWCFCGGGMIWVSLSIFFSPFSWGCECVWDCVFVSCVGHLICFSPPPQLPSPHYPFAFLN